MSTCRKYVTVLTDEAGDNINALRSEPIRFISVMNKSAASAAATVQVFNVPIASVTVGTTQPIIALSVEGDDAANLVFPDDGFDMGGTGISVAITLTSTGNGAADGVVTVGVGT